MSKKVITILEYENGFIIPLKYMKEYPGGITRSELKQMIPKEDIPDIEIRILKLTKSQSYEEFFSEDK